MGRSRCSASRSQPGAAWAVAGGNVLANKRCWSRVVQAEHLLWPSPGCRSAPVAALHAAELVESRKSLSDGLINTEAKSSGAVVGVSAFLCVADTPWHTSTHYTRSPLPAPCLSSCCSSAPSWAAARCLKPSPGAFSCSQLAALALLMAKLLPALSSYCCISVFPSSAPPPAPSSTEAVTELGLCVQAWSWNDN